MINASNVREFDEGRDSYTFFMTQGIRNINAVMPDGSHIVPSVITLGNSEHNPQSVCVYIFFVILAVD